MPCRNLGVISETSFLASDHRVPQKAVFRANRVRFTLPRLGTSNKPALGTVGWFPSHPMARTVHKEAADILYSHKDPLVAEILRWYSMVQRIAFTYPSQWLISLITQLNGKLLGWKGYLCKELSISTLLILPNLESSQWFARYQGGTPSVPSAWLYHRMAILKCSPIWLQLCEDAGKAWIGRMLGLGLGTG